MGVGGQQVQQHMLYPWQVSICGRQVNEARRPEIYFQIAPKDQKQDGRIFLKNITT